MQIELHPRPEKERLLRDLQAGLGRSWNVRYFGLGRYKTIIVSRSPLHAVQISYSGQHEVQVEGTYASLWSALVASLDTTFGTGLTSYPQMTAWKHLEQEIVDFLESEYLIIPKSETEKSE